MEQIKMLEALAEAAERLDDKRLADFLATLRAAEKQLQAVLHERLDWRQFREAIGRGQPELREFLDAAT